MGKLGTMSLSERVVLFKRLKGVRKATGSGQQNTTHGFGRWTMRHPTRRPQRLSFRLCELWATGHLTATG